MRRDALAERLKDAQTKVLPKQSVRDPNPLHRATFSNIKMTVRARNRIAREIDKLSREQWI